MTERFVQDDVGGSFRMTGRFVQELKIKRIWQRKIIIEKYLQRRT